MKLIFKSDAIKNDLIFDRVFVNDLFRQRATNIEENFNPRIIRGGTVVMLGFLPKQPDISGGSFIAFSIDD